MNPSSIFQISKCVMKGGKVITDVHKHILFFTFPSYKVSRIHPFFMVNISNFPFEEFIYFSLLLWTKHVTVNEVCVLKTLFLIFFACNWCRSNNLSPENDCWEFFIISNFFFVKWKQKILELLHILQNVYKNNCNDNVFFWKTVCSIWKWKEFWISKHLVTIFRGI